MRVSSVALIAALGTAGCEPQEFEPPSREARVQRADSVYSLSLFDTVAWASDSARVLEGNVVYSSECRDCHGSMGQGATEYARQRGLTVPSLVEPDWEPEGNLEQVRRLIFVGHPAGMPSWGISRVTPREIDAVAYYLVMGLRPEVSVR